MKDSKGGFMVEEDDGRKEESDRILKRKELLEQLKKPFFDPRKLIAFFTNSSTEHKPSRQSPMF
jgi:hypothetical protein